MQILELQQIGIGDIFPWTDSNEQDGLAEEIVRMRPAEFRDLTKASLNQLLKVFDPRAEVTGDLFHVYLSSVGTYKAWPKGNIIIVDIGENCLMGIYKGHDYCCLVVFY